MQRVNANDYRPWQTAMFYQESDECGNITAITCPDFPFDGYVIASNNLVETSPYFDFVSQKLYVPFSGVIADIIGYDEPCYYVLKRNPSMIYTIGHRENYLKEMSRRAANYLNPMTKTGRGFWGGEYYHGGYAFKTIEDAQRRINEAHKDAGYAVFGIDADWERDTVRADDGWWHLLLKHAVVLKLDIT